MGDDSCDCHVATDDRTENRTHGGATATDSVTDRVLSGESPLDAPLPGDLGRALGDASGVPPVATLDEWIHAIREYTGGGAIGVDDLCHVDEPTPHWGDLDGERYHFACFYDAVVLAALADGRVDVHTESPDGTAVEARAVGTESLDVDPDGAVFSIGCDPDAVPAGEPSHEAIYAAVCPYVRAFPSVAAYDRWRATVSAATAATTLAGGTELAAALVA